MRKVRKRKCRNCKKYFIPDHRNINRQKYCKETECKNASKSASQEKWLSKPENKNYFRSKENVRRVQDWRKKRPGYWKKSNLDKNALQDSLKGNSECVQDVKGDLNKNALQDSLGLQDPVFIGLISNLIGSALQDDIVNTARKMREIGTDILFGKTEIKGGSNGKKTTDISGKSKEDTEAFQLGGSATG